MVLLLVQPLQLKLLTLFPGIFGFIRNCHVNVRLTASKCITSMEKKLTTHVMEGIKVKIIPMFRDSSFMQVRQSAGMLVTSLVEELGVKLVAYAPLLVVRLLGCMSDSVPTIGQSVMSSFSPLVALVLLAKGVPPTSRHNENLSSRSVEDAHFLEQPLDNSQVDDYKQWLAFLKRFKIHWTFAMAWILGKHSKPLQLENLIP